MNPYSVKKLPIDIEQGIAQKHRELRRKMGYSQEELSNRSGVSLGSLKRFERTGQISLKNLLKLAHVLDRLNDFENLFSRPKDMDEIEQLFSDKTR